MYLKRGSYFDSPSAVGFSLEDFGFSLRCRQNDICVSEVDPNGPAYAKGMRQQDVVIRVDDVDVASYTLSELWPLLSQKDKEQLTITIKRGDDIKQLSFNLKGQDASAE
ncbi:MAG: PDZ domain-containing protein [Planctomycetota bacterium]|jgi:C-terminal processing protease CtpA/Prc